MWYSKRVLNRGDFLVMTNRLPEKLTALRKHFGYSQGDMAEKLGVQVSEYMNWENGNTICGIAHLRQMAKMYRVPIEDLADNTRTVTLPRLDEEEDSFEISFTGTAPVSGASVTGTDLSSLAGNQAVDQTADLAMDLIAKTTVPEETAKQGYAAATPSYTAPAADENPEATRIISTAQLQETEVTRIVDETSEVHTPVRKTKPKKTYTPPVEEDDEYEEPYEKEPGLFERVDKRILIGAAAGIAGIALIFSAARMLGGKGSSSAVSLTNTNRFALGSTFSMYLQSEGNLVTTGKNAPALDSEDLVQVSAGPSWAMGLKKDGTVVCAGAANACKVDGWSKIVMVAAGENHSVGLKSDGTLECNGSSSACDVSSWKDVKSVYAGNEITLGITDTGDVLVSGDFSSKEKVKNLTNVRSAAIGYNQIAITGIDGSVTCYAVGASSTSNTSAWSGMDSAAVGGSFAAGLSGGKVTVASSDEELVNAAKEWSGIQYIAARNNTLAAVNSNGTVIGAGDNSSGIYGENDATPEPESSEDPDKKDDEKTNKLASVSNVQFNVTSANLQISWTGVQNAAYYTVKVNTSPETSLKTEKPSASISTDKLRSGTSYTVTITACAKDGDDKPKDSDPLSVTYVYQANLTKLSVPSNIVCTQNGTEVEITWSPVNNASYYEVTLEDMSKSVSEPRAVFDMSLWNASREFTVYVTAYPGQNDTRFTFSDTGNTSGRYEIIHSALAQPVITYTGVEADGTSVTISWTPVEHAGGYTVTFGGQTMNTADTRITFYGIIPGEYSIVITANPSDPVRYDPSSVTGSYYVPEPSIAPTPTPTPEPTAEPTVEPTPDPEPTPTPEGTEEQDD